MGNQRGDRATTLTREAGPVRTELHEPRQWDRRPKIAAALRALIALVPTLVSFTVTYMIARYLPPETIGVHAVLWWLGLSAAGIATLLIVDRTVRQLLPLVALFRLSLIFPDQAPSRFSIALRTGTTRQLQRRLETVRRAGFPDDHQRQAEELLDLVAALSRHDRMTRGHCERVRAYTDLLAEEMNLDREAANKLRWAALAHDVGKVFVSADILNSPETPVGDDWDEIKSHTWLGDELVEPLRPWLGEWLDAVGQHHERWDGDGYPAGLQKTDIHLGARIVAVADAFDVMTSRRSYKKAMSARLARAEIAENAGSQFDPEVVRALLNISIGRLRFAIGPVTWLLNIPSATTATLTPLVAPTATTATAATTTLAAAILGYGPPVPEQLAASAEIDIVEAYNEVFEPPVSQSPPPAAAPEEPAPTTVPSTTTTAPPTTTAEPAKDEAKPEPEPTPTVRSRDTTTTVAPSTTAPPTTATPSTTAPATTAPTTTAAPASTTSTTAPPPPTIELIVTSDDYIIFEDGEASFVITVNGPNADVAGAIVLSPLLGTLTLTELPSGAFAVAGTTDDLSAQANPDPIPDHGEVDGDETMFVATYTPRADESGLDTMQLEFCRIDSCQTIDLNVEVAPVQDPPTITPIDGDVVIVQGEPVSVAVTASDSDGDTLSYRAENLPSGLEIDPETGVISGVTTDEPGAGTFIVFVTDSGEPPTTSSLDVPFRIDAPVPPPWQQTLIISAARHHSSPGDDLIDEFVEITNVSDQPVDLTTMLLQDYAIGAERDERFRYCEFVDTSFNFAFPANDIDGAASTLEPGQTARIWISDPNGTNFTIGHVTVTTEAFAYADQADLSYVIEEANWHRLDLMSDDLWLLGADDHVEDFVRWRTSAEAVVGPPPEWWIVPFETEEAWALSGTGTIVEFDHDRSHRTN